MNDYKQAKKIASKKKTLSNINLAIRVSIWLCLGVSCFLIVSCGAAYVVNSELFKVKSIDIKGNEHLDADEVLSLLDLDVGDNILGWDMESARQRLRGHPWVKDVSISRSLIPAGIGVRIVEHRPTATLILKDKPYLISEDGTVFAPAPEENFGLMIQAREYEPLNQRGNVDGVLKSAMRAVSVVESKGLKVKDLIIEAGGVMNIRLDKGITLVILGEMTPLKVDMALRAMQEVKPVHGTVMDLTCEDKIVLRNRGGYGREG
ncbi:MAG: FtsQ-type POTRA domain-containing protein [Desulfomonilia bacterium]|jgi:hypothetical protein